MDKELLKLLLTELNMVSYIPGETENITDHDMVLALTANENLGSLGYTLKPSDIVRLAASENCGTLFAEIEKLLPDVKAEPMYPDFPTQVMNMSSAEFRFHQMLHYFSTYGVEMLTGSEVKRGWLPDVDKTEKTKSDTSLLEKRVLELSSEEEICEKALTRILGKRERMTIPESLIVKYAVRYVDEETLQNLKVTFKENAEILFDEALAMDKEDGILVMKAVCQHSGDVLKNVYRVLKSNRFHLRTSQKKLFVRLLESYSVADFRGNLMKSKHNREKNLLILQKLDYNTYSRSEEHQKVVNELRDDKLKSWDSVAKKMLENHTEGALDFVAKRPGTMLRMVNWLLTLGYSEEEISDNLCVNAHAFSTQTIIGVLNRFATLTVESIHREAADERDNIYRRYRFQLDANSEGVLRDQMNYEIRCLEREYNSKSDRIVWALHRECDEMTREWKSDELNACENREIEALELPYRKEITSVNEVYFEGRKKLESEISAIRSATKSERKKKSEREIIRDSLYLYMKSSGNPENAEAFRENFTLCDEKVFKAEKRCAEIEGELLQLKKALEDDIKVITDRMDAEIGDRRDEINRKYREMRAVSKEKITKITDEYNLKIEKVLAEGNEHYQEELEAKIAGVKADYEAKIAASAETLKELEKKMDAEIKLVDLREESNLKQLSNLPVKRRILQRVLKCHLEQITTMLKGKKVYLDLPDFDLVHSQLLCSKKSDEGGYIPSGIAYRIPEDAGRVRFFTYWNDKDRVDVDLHAVGTTMTGDYLHIGWNGDYNNSGVTHSGDITHSNAAEYIDVDMSKPVKRIFTSVWLYSGKKSLSDIEECYVGMMAVDSVKKDVKLYDRANCYFAHDLRMNCRGLFYGYIDVEKRYVKFVGRPNEHGSIGWEDEDSDEMFSLEKYLDVLFESQNVTVTCNKDEADIILSMGKSVYENGVSLVDENFFMDVV